MMFNLYCCQNRNQNLPAMKEMEVCEVCGAFLVVGDAQQRLEEHLMGKQHMGYARVRNTIEDMKVCRNDFFQLLISFQLIDGLNTIKLNVF